MGGDPETRGGRSHAVDHWKTTTFLSALRHDGFTAPWVSDGPLDGALFRAYVEQHLTPTLQPGSGEPR